MSLRPKILFDECLSHKAVEALIGPLRLIEDNFDLAHVIEEFGAGALDEEWIPKAAGAGWTIITADRGKKSRVEAKLPLLCKAFRVTHILMAPGFTKRRMYFKVLKVQELWEEILAAASGPKGARYSMRLTGAHSAKLVLLESPIAEPGSDTDLNIETNE